MPERQPAIPARPTFVRLLVLLLSCGLSFLLYLHRYAWGFIKKDVQDEFGWDTVTLGWLDSLFVFTYGLGQVPSGIVGDWFGARAVLGGSVLLWSLALAGFAVAGSLAAFAAARLLFGAAQAGCYPMLSKVTKNWFPLGMRPAAQGLIATLSGRSGGAAAYLLFGVLLGLLGLPWRSALLLLAAVGMGTAVLFFLLFRNSPREHPWANAAEADLISAGDPEAAHAVRSVLPWGALLRRPTVLLLCLRALISNLADAVYVNWIPLYLRTLWKLDAQEAGWMAALPLVGGALGGFTSGLLQSMLLYRTGDRRWSRAGVALTGKMTAAALMVVVLGLEHPAMVACVLMAVRFFCDWEQPAEWGAVTDLGGRGAGSLFAVVNTAGTVGGFIAGPLIGLVLHGHSEDGVPSAEGWNAVFILVAVEYLAAALCWLAIDCRRPLTG